ncbi:MAG: alginate export family protein, partial [Psychrosphaera sp.]|nr:alginate export family protein [Psychrosphaera sp.]
MKVQSPKLSVVALALLPTLGLMSFTASADMTETIAKAVKDGKTSITLRYRYESVEQDGIGEDASASTLKTRLTWQSGKANNFSVKIEVDDVTAIGDDDYNSTANGMAQYPVVADPEGTDVNQAFIQYTNDQLTFSAGRQRVLHNDQRFVGGVGWRQNEQTYDGYRLKYNASKALKFDYTYVFNVNRIFGPSGGKADLRGNIHLFTANYAISKTSKLAFFGYSMDFDTAAGASNNTFGVRYTGKYSSLNVSASYASQSDAGDNPTSFDTDYFALEVGTKVSGITFAAGYENLGGDNGVGFMTPLATL